MSEASAKVLLVDDDAMVRMLVQAGLTQRGFEVKAAASGVDALRVFDRWRPELVLLDALMPGMNGFDACRAIRSLPDGEHVPIVILTGLRDDASISLAYEAGATDFYVKSSQMTLLAERVRYLLRTARMREELVRSRTRLARAQQIARLGSWEWTLGERLIEASPEALRILGLPERTGTLAEESFVRTFIADGVDAFRFEVLTSLRAGRAHCLSGRVRAGDDWRDVEIEVEAERDDEGNIRRVSGTVQDVTERRNAEERMQRLSSFDGLTGLANRSRFRARVEEALAGGRRTGRRFAVMLVGLDRLKHINASLGATAGDEVLRQVAERLGRSVRSRERDALARAGEAADASEGSALGRLNGDEFAVLLADLGARDDAALVAQRVLDAIREPLEIEGQECWITASIGICAYPEDGDSADLLLQRADVAMRAAKDGGRDGFRFHVPAAAPPAIGGLRLEADLHRALERDELRLHWQPIFDAASGLPRGAEVLMRWQRGDRLVPPGEFIPLAEETGLIVPMGDWALAQACAQQARWRAAGLPPVYVGVNLTASHVQQRDLERQVGGLLATHGLPADALCLEVTESLMMDFAAPTLRGLAALRELGVRVAIDDFGTGYSSLSYLKRLPVTALKIDRSFVIDIASGSDDRAIVSAIAGLARSLSLSVIAEGIETEAQRDALRAQGVTLMQGYLFGRPMAVGDFEALLRGSASDVSITPAPEAGPSDARTTDAGTSDAGTALPLHAG